MLQTGKKYISSEQVYRRAGGRRRYNAERQRQAALRRVFVELRFLDVAQEFLATGKTPRGWQTRLARELGVSRMQIGRDFKAVCANDRTVAHIAYMLNVARIIFKPIPGLKRLKDY